MCDCDDRGVHKPCAIRVLLKHEQTKLHFDVKHSVSKELARAATNYLRVHKGKCPFQTSKLTLQVVDLEELKQIRD